MKQQEIDELIAYRALILAIADQQRIAGNVGETMCAGMRADRRVAP